MKRSWARNLFTRPFTHPIRKTKRRAPLTLELLEDRLVPSTYTVTNTNDTGAGSLRDAVAQANANTGTDTIFFSSLFNTAQTITLTSGAITFTDTATTTITGPGAGLLSVSGNNASQVFFINSGDSASLSGLTVTQGNINNTWGGGVSNSGTLTLADCTISASTSSGSGRGGGLANLSGGTATLTSCTVSGNTAGFQGGGIENYGSMTLTGCTVSGNGGAGISGAGINAQGGGPLILVNTTISNNTSTGGGGSGGGIAANGIVLLTDCTISGNTANNAGGLLEYASTMTLTDCTISGNDATGTGAGGGIYMRFGSLNLTDVTISGNTANSGGGISNTSGSGTLTIVNTIVSVNTAATSPDIVGTINTDNGYNLFGSALSGTTSGTGDVFSDTPMLAALADNGGPTQTMALLTGSPALDAGSAGLAASEVQTATATGSTGTFTLTFNGQTTASLTLGASAASVQAALNALTSIGGVGGSVTVTQAGTDYIITFGSSLAATNVSQITGVGSGGATVTTATLLDGNTDQRGRTRSGNTDIGAYDAIKVTNTNDSGAGSLRQAVLDANASAFADAVVFTSLFNTTQTITLTSGQLTLTDAATTTINGPGASLLSVSGNNASRVFAVNSGASVAMTGLTITGGNSTGGSGLLNNGTATLTDIIVNGNTAPSAPFGGGGVQNSGTITLTNCTISGNSAGNRAGGLSNIYSGQATLTDCTVSGNTGVFGGGLTNDGANAGGVGMTLTLINTTVSGNTASGPGGGLYTIRGGTATFINCTVSGNTSSSFGGGIAISGIGGGTLTMGNTIVAGNTATSSGPDVSVSAVISQGYNLIGKTDGSTGWVGSDLTGTVASPLNPQLAALANNGGPTQTLALLPNSPAIDAGSNSVATGAGLTTDERGLPRIEDGTGTGTAVVDIGAFEVQNLVVSNTNDTGAGSLRSALTTANAEGSSLISFAISGTAPFTITPLSALPTLTAPLVIDGATEPGYAGSPLIVLNGASAGGSAVGLTLAGGNTTVKGLVIDHFGGDGIDVTSNGNVIESNYIGVNAAGTAAAGNGGNGIFVSTASNNTIGGTTAALGNVISGNAQVGVMVANFASGNKVEANLIGTNTAGTAAIANGFNGVKIFNHSSNNQIGTDGADGFTADVAEGNVISGNTLDGVLIDGNNTTGTKGNIVGGNFIGTDYFGTIAVANGGNGVLIKSEAQNNIIGIDSSAADQADMINLISGNSSYGIQVDGSTTTGNVLDWNYIGIAAGGASTIPNTSGALDISNSASVQVLNNNIPASSALNGNVADGGTLDVNGTDLSIIGALTGSGIVTNSAASGTATLTINGTGTFSGIIQDGSTAHIALTVAGGTVTLAGANTYSGGTNVNAGTLLVTGTLGTGTVAIAGGATLNDQVIDTNDSGPGSLRQAIVNANLGTGAGANLITFNLTGTAPFTIAPLSALSTITASVTIDGTTEPGYVSSPLIVLNGASAGGSAVGLTLTGGNSTVKGLVIDNFGGDGIDLTTNGGDTIQGNYIGTNAAGSAVSANGGLAAIFVNSVSSNTIGGTAAGAGNLIVGSTSEDAGILLQGASGGSNVVQGNFIGTDSTGLVALGKLNDGIDIQSSNNTIGGTTSAARNLIDNSNNIGIAFQTGNSDNNLIVGNYVGVGADGQTPLGNTNAGIDVFSDNGSNTIGGTVAGAGNLISANGTSGIRVLTPSNLIQGNYIGTDVTGTTALGNGTDGVLVTSGASGNTIGGGNVISANGSLSNTNSADILVSGSGTSNNVIEGNSIGTNAGGTATLGSGYASIIIGGGANNNVIGGTTAAARNVISGHVDRNIHIDNNISGTLVQGNYIGTTADGTASIGYQASYGIRIQGAGNNTIGGLTATPGTGPGNVISGNNIGISIIDFTAAGTATIEGNVIGANASGTAAVPNFDGIYVGETTASQQIGGTAAGTRNLISGNTSAGVGFNITTANSVVQGNWIGTDITGNAALGNGVGVFISDGANNITVGGTAGGAGNVISGNSGDGIQITGSGVSGNIIEGNYIGTNAAGSAAIANHLAGIDLTTGAASNNIGGTAAGQGNIIAFNTHDGVQITGATTTNNSVRGNSIYANGGLGIDLAGTGNNNQAFPTVIAAAVDSSASVSDPFAGTTQIKATFTGAANTTYQLDFYDNLTTVDPSGFGQGRTHIGTTTITTDGSGNPAPGSSTFFAVLNATLPAGDVLSITATDPAGNTSEFSNDVTSILRPEFALTGLPTSVRGQLAPYTITPAASGTDLAAGLTYAITWGDGNSENDTSSQAPFVVRHIFTTPQPPNTPYAVQVAIQDQYGFTGLSQTFNTQVNVFALEASNSEIDVGGQIGGSTFELTGVLSATNYLLDTFNLDVDGGAANAVNGGFTINYSQFSPAVLSSLTKFVLWGQAANTSPGNVFDASDSAHQGANPYVGTVDIHNGPGFNTLVGSPTGVNNFNYVAHATDSLLIVAPPTATNSLSFVGSDQGITFNLGELNGQVQQVTPTGDMLAITGSLPIPGQQTTTGALNAYVASDFGDTVTIPSGYTTTYTPTKNLSLTGGAGNDTFTISPGGTGNDTFQIQNTSYTGTTGNDTFQIGTTGTSNDTFQIQNSTFMGGTGNDTFQIGNSASTTNDTFTISGTTVNSGAGNDSFMISAGTGNDTFTIGGSTFSGNDTFTIGGPTVSNDTFTINNNGTYTGNDTFTLGTTGVGNDTFTINNTGALAGSANDTFTIQTGTGVTNDTFTINGGVTAGTGNDTFTIGGVSAGNDTFMINGGVTAGTGNDTFTIGGSASGSNDTFMISGGVTAGTGNDTFTIGATTGTNDTFTIGGTVTTSGGNDTFTIGSSTGTNDTFTIGGITSNGANDTFTIGSGTGANDTFTIGGITNNGANDTFTIGSGTGANDTFTMGTVSTSGTGANDTFTIVGSTGSNDTFTIGSGGSGVSESGSNDTFSISDMGASNDTFTITGGVSVTGNDTFTMTGVGTGNDTFTIGGTVTTTGGNDTFTIGSGSALNDTFTITGGVSTTGGNDTFTIGGGAVGSNDTFTIGGITNNGANDTFTIGSGTGANDTFTMGTVSTSGTGANDTFTIVGSTGSNDTFTIGSGGSGVSESGSNDTFSISDMGASNDTFTITGGVSVTGNDTFTMTGVGTGNDTFTIGGTVTTTGGNDTFTIGSGNALNDTFTITGGVSTTGGNDTFTIGGGAVGSNDTFTIGGITNNGANDTFTIGSGTGANDTFTMGTVSTSGTGANDTFTIVGSTGSNDTFTIGSGGSGVSESGSNDTFSISDMGASNDTFTITGGVSVTGNDTFTMTGVGTGNDTFTIGGTVTTTGGNDTFTIGSGNALNDTFTITGGVSTTGGNDTFTIGGGAVGSNDTFTIGGITNNGANDTFTIGSGTGANDTFTMGTVSTSGTGANDTFTIVGSTGSNDTFTIGSGGTGVSESGSNDTFSISDMGASNDTFTISGGVSVTGNDTFTMTGVGTGNDTFTIGGTVTTTGGNDTFTIGSGSALNDTFTITGGVSTTGGNDTFTIGGGAVGSNDTFTIGGITNNGANDTFTIGSGTGANDTFTMGSVVTSGTGANDTFTIVGGTGSNDTFTIGGIANSGANDTFTINDSGASNDTVTMTGSVAYGSSGTGDKDVFALASTGTGSDTFTIVGAVTANGAGNDTFIVQGGSNQNDTFAIDGGVAATGTGNDTFAITDSGATGGNDTFQLNSNFTGGAGNDTFIIQNTNTGASNDTFLMNGSVQLGSGGNDTFTINGGVGTGNDAFTINGSVTGGTGNDTFTIGAGSTTSAGNDTFTITGTITGGTGNDTFQIGTTGTGNDTFTIGGVSSTSSTGNDTFTIGSTGVGNDTFTIGAITGGTGNDTFFLTQSGGGNDTFTIPNGVSGAGNDTFALNNGGASTGNDSFTLNSNLVGGSGTNEFFIQDPNSGASNDTMTVNGNLTASGGNSIFFVTNNGAGNDTFLINGALTGGGGSSSFEINNTGNGNDTFAITGGLNDTGAANDTFILSNPGNGNDSFTISGGVTFGSGQGEFSVNSLGNGTDTYTINGNVTLGSGNDSFFTSSLEGAGNQSFTVNGGVSAGDGSDFFTLGAAGDGNNTFTITGPVAYGSGADSFQLNGSGAGSVTFNLPGGVSGAGYATYTINDPGAVNGNESFTVNGSLGGGPGNNTFLISSGLNNFGGSDTFTLNGNLTGGAGFNTFSLADSNHAGNSFTLAGSLIGGSNDTNDSFELAGVYGTINMVSGTGTGTDSYQLIGGVQANVQITAPDQATRMDVLDFSNLSNAVSVDLGQTAAQTVAPGLALKLSDANGFSSVVGTPMGDTIHGNARSDALTAAQKLDSNYNAGAPAVGANGKVQVVLLDFDTAYTAAGGVYNFNSYYGRAGITPLHVYSTAERQAILGVLENDYAPFLFVPGQDNGGVYFTLSQTDAQAMAQTYTGSATQYITEYFDQSVGAGGDEPNPANPPPGVAATPQFEPGGTSTDLDFRDADMTGTASIQVNGILGEPLMPPATDQNWVSMSAKIAAHELGHLLGLHHEDAFGPIGQGIIPLPDGKNYSPPYPGPYDASETFDNIMTSGDSVGASRWNDLRSLSFNEREDVELALAFEAPTTPTPGTLLVPQSSGNTTPSSPQSVALQPMNVPNTVDTGINAGLTFDVQAVDVAGQVGLDPATGQAQANYYSFTGNQNDLINIDVWSAQVARYKNQGPSGYIDSTVYLYYQNPDGSLTQVAYYNTPAFNDDTYQSSDSQLVDVYLPQSGTYVVKVASFSYAVAGVTPPTQAQIGGLSDPEQRQDVEDAVNGTDIGNYDLFIYRFKAGVTNSGTNTFYAGTGGGTITGAGSNNTLIVDPNVDMVLSNGSLSLSDGTRYTLNDIQNADLTIGPDAHQIDASGWTGGGSLVATNGNGTLVVGNSASALTVSNGSVQSTNGLNLSISGFDNAVLTGSSIAVAGWTGTATINGQGGTPLATPQGESFTAFVGDTTDQEPVATFSDPSGTPAAGTYSASIDWGDQTTSTGIVDINGSTVTILGTHAYANVGVYGITVTIEQGTAYSVMVTSQATIRTRATTTALVSSATNDTSVYGQNTTFTATVTPDALGSGTPTGSVDFVDTTTGQDLGTYPLVDGSASVGISALAALSHVIEADYASDTNNYNASFGTLTQVVNPFAFTYQIGSDSQTYGTAANLASALPPTISTGVFGQTLAISYSSTGDTATAHVQSGGYDITGTLSNGTGLTSNYTVTLVAGSLTVNPYAFTYPIGNDNQTYGSPANLAHDLGATIPTGVNSQNLDIAYSSTGDTASAVVGSYPITGVLSNGSGKLSDYSVTLVNGTLTVVVLPGSIYALDPTAGGALSVSGGASIAAPGNVVADSNSTTAIQASGSASVTGAGVQVVGHVHTSGGAVVQTPTGAPGATGDPLAGLAVPIANQLGLTNQGSVNLSGSASRTIYPGIYSQITVSGSAHLTLSQGDYIIAGGGFTVSNGASVSGSGVMIYNTASTYNPATGVDGSGGTFGSIALSGSGTFNVSAPTSGTYAGILIFQDRGNSKALSIGASGALTTNGTIYAPRAQLTLSGNSRLTDTLIVDTVSVSGSAQANGLVSPSGSVVYTPDQIRTAYGVAALDNLATPLDGTGQTIAIVDAYNNPALYSAVDAFDSQFGATSSGPSLYDQYGAAASFLTVLNQDGQPTSLPTTDPSGQGSDNWEVEESVDVQWAHAMAPGARIILVEANSQTLSDLMNAVATAAAQPGVSVVSMSWGFVEGQQVLQADEAQYDSYFNKPGVTFVASTGDYGGADPEYPAFSPNVLAVGGTSLLLNQDNTYQSETGWGYNSAAYGSFIGSGGGISQYASEPGFQANVQSTGFRTTPDVSFFADPGTGAWIADPYNLTGDSPFEAVGGTSLSAPCWAGLVALANQGRAAAGEGSLNATNSTDTQQALYSLPQAEYHSITSGFNGYDAGPGYNLVTGLGTPMADRLVPDLIAWSGPGTAYSGATVAPLQSTNLVYYGADVNGPINVLSVFNAELIGFGGSADVAAEVQQGTSATSGGILQAGQDGPVAETLTASPASAIFSGSQLVRSPLAALSAHSVAQLMTAFIPGASATYSVGGRLEQAASWLPASGATLDSRLPGVDGGQLAALPQAAEQPTRGDTAEQRDNDDSILVGGAGSDILIGGQGNGLMAGGFGADSELPGQNADTMNGTPASAFTSDDALLALMANGFTADNFDMLLSDLETSA